MLGQTIQAALGYMSNAGFTVLTEQHDSFAVLTFVRGNVLLRVAAEDATSKLSAQLYLNVTPEDLKHSHLIAADADELLHTQLSQKRAEFFEQYTQKLSAPNGLRGVRKERLRQQMCKNCADEIKALLPAISAAAESTQARISAKLI